MGLKIWGQAFPPVGSQDESYGWHNFDPDHQFDMLLRPNPPGSKKHQENFKMDGACLKGTVTRYGT